MDGVITNNLRKDITLIYVGVFGRAPDGEGLDYWYNIMISKGADLRTLADWMYYAALSVQPEIADPYALVKAIYSNILGKPDDQKGIDYWVGEIRSGKATPGKIVADILWVAATEYKDSVQTKNLLLLSDIGLQVSKYFYSPDLNSDKKIDTNEISVFKSLIAFNTIDLNKDGLLTLDEITACMNKLPQLAMEYYKCPSSGTSGCPPQPSLISLPSEYKAYFSEIEYMLPTIPSNYSINLDTIIVSFISEVLQAFKEQNVSLNILLDEENEELYNLLNWYESNKANLPSFIPIMNATIPNCLTWTSLSKGSDGVYYYDILTKDGKSYSLTLMQFASIFPIWKTYLIQTANESLADEEADYSEKIFAKHVIDVIGKMPDISCPVSSLV